MLTGKNSFMIFPSAALLLAGVLPLHAQNVLPQRMSGTSCAQPTMRPVQIRPLRAPQAAPVKSRAQRLDVVADGEAIMHAYLRYDTRTHSYGVIDMRTDAPSEYAVTRDLGMNAGSSAVFTAGTMVGDRFLAYQTTYYSNTLMPDGIAEINPTTGEYELKWKYDLDDDHLIFDEMTYDPKTGSIFAMHYSTVDRYTNIYSIDPETLRPTLVATTTKVMLTLSADNGNLYGVGYNTTTRRGFLYRIAQSSIDATAKTCEVEDLTGSAGLGFKIGNYSQSMEFDKTTHRLWWVCQAYDENAYLVELDPATGQVISKALIEGAPQVLAIGIPYQFVADAAPSYVCGLAVTTTDGDGTGVQLSWTNPQKDYRGNALTSLQGVRIYRDGQLVQTISAPSPGVAMQYTDSNAPQGYHIYKVEPYNASGAGITKERDIFVGYDVPAKPRNVQLTASGNTATLTWDAPEEGAQGGKIDTQTLSYEVVRMPDNKKIASANTSRSITDNVTHHAGYYYVVTAINKQGRGECDSSNVVAFGPAYGVPFSSPLDTQSDFDRWTPVDNNGDSKTWTFNQYDRVATYDRADIDADDWLVSPALIFEGGKTYQLRYTYYTTNWVTPDTYEEVMEKMDVRYGQQTSPASLTTVVRDLGQFHTASATYLYGRDNFKPADGDGYVAFRVYSEKNHGQVFLKDVTIREYSATDLSAAALTGSATANCGVSQTFTVTVSNEGSAAVDSYKVQLVDADSGSVLAEAAGTAVGKDKTVDVPVAWTPTAEGTLNITAKVVLDGDTYPDDNTLATPKKVSVAAADADKWVTLGTDDTYGWLMPFYLFDRYSQSQSIYLDREMQKKNVAITGLRLTYDGETDATYTFPAQISMKHTALSSLEREDNKYYGMFDNSGWTTVYDGDITVGGKGNGLELDVRFDTPFNYTTGNVAIRFIAKERDETITENHPLWHFTETTGDRRYSYYRENSAEITADNIFTSEYVPYIMLSYTGGDGTGIANTALNGVAWTLGGGHLCLTHKADRIALYTAQGSLAAQAANADCLAVGSLPRGVYVLRIANGGGTSAHKIVLP